MIRKRGERENEREREREREQNLEELLSVVMRTSPYNFPLLDSPAEIARREWERFSSRKIKLGSRMPRKQLNRVALRGGKWMGWKSTARVECFSCMRIKILGRKKLN